MSEAIHLWKTFMECDSGKARRAGLLAGGSPASQPAVLLAFLEIVNSWNNPVVSETAALRSR